MKHYEIIVNNGDYPLTYKCSTIAEAFGCLDTLRTGLLHSDLIAVDMDKVVELLVSMKQGNILSHTTYDWSIFAREGEV